MIGEQVLIDTGPFAALFDRRDPLHDACRRQFDDLPVGKCFTCWPVVTEAVYLLRKHPQKRDLLLDLLGQASSLFCPWKMTS
jgi:predicted nucleic acid-binding protein